MFRKGLIFAFAMLLLASVATAEPIRTLTTKENKMPDKHYLELGAAFEFTEFDENTDSLTTGDNMWRGIGKARYGITENWTILTEIPYVDLEPSIGESESGMGDIMVGTELRVYEDVLGYPWVMPHAEASLDTASEDVLGAGDTTYMIGLAIGTVVDDFALGVAAEPKLLLRRDAAVRQRCDCHPVDRLAREGACRAFRGAVVGTSDRAARFAQAPSSSSLASSAV